MSQEKLWNANYIKIWTVNFLVHFSFMLIVPLLPLYLSETFGATKDTIGMVLTGYSIMALLIRPFSGYMVDSFPRKTVLVICGLLFFGIFAGYLAAGSLAAFAIFRTIHGAPFGATTVAASTVAIDVVPSSRRGEAIGYYGLSNNLAMALGPALAIVLLEAFYGNYKALFWVSLGASFIGLLLELSIRIPKRDFVPEKKVLSFDRFFLLHGWREAIGIACFAFSYGILSTYVAIYGKEELGITGGTGLFFGLCAIGLILSRLTGARYLRDGKVSRNASMGMCVSLVGYFLFAALHNPIGYYGAALIIGLGNGHMYPAFQTMFINLAEHSQRGTANSSILTSWDAGVGLGVLIGGLCAEFMGYHSAFWASWIVNLFGVIYYFGAIRGHFESNKLR